MRIALWALGIVVALVALVAIVGWSLPVKHRATREATVAARPEAVWAAITGVEELPRWRSKVKAAERVALPQGGQGFRETGDDGAILYAIEQAEPPRRLVTRIADPSLPFGGRWTWELTPTGTGTTVRITEDGEVYNPIFRFVSRFVIGHTASIDGYLSDLGRKFGVKP